MGLISAADDFISGADDAASGADDAASGADDTSDAFKSDPIGGEADISYTDDPFGKRVFADVTTRTTENVTGAPKALAGGLKWVGGGTAAAGGLYAGSKAYGNWADLQAKETKQESYDAYQQAREDIRTDPNLSPEEKQERLDELRETYEQTIEEINSGGSGDDGLLSSLPGMDALSDFGMLEKLIIAAVVLAFIKQGAKVLSNR